MKKNILFIVLFFPTLLGYSQSLNESNKSFNTAIFLRNPLVELTNEIMENYTDHDYLKVSYLYENLGEPNKIDNRTIELANGTYEGMIYHYHGSRFYGTEEEIFICIIDDHGISLAYDIEIDASIPDIKSSLHFLEYYDDGSMLWISGPVNTLLRIYYSEDKVTFIQWTFDPTSF